MPVISIKRQYQKCNKASCCIVPRLCLTYLLCKATQVFQILEVQIGNIEVVSKHTSQNSFYKQTKISSLEITIFYLKMMVKSGLDFLFYNSPSPFRVAAAKCKNIYPKRLNWPGRLAGTEGSCLMRLLGPGKSRISQKSHQAN